MKSNINVKNLVWKYPRFSTKIKIMFENHKINFFTTFSSESLILKKLYLYLEWSFKVILKTFLKY